MWKQLGHRQTALITNGDFATEPSGHGFDWRLAHPPGVTDIALPGAHRIVFSGKQPESCELLRQFVVLEPGQEVFAALGSANAGIRDRPRGSQWNEARRGVSKARKTGAAAA